MTSVETTEKSKEDTTNNNSQTGLNNPKTVRVLQIAVIAMGIILVLGLITVLGRILYLYLGNNKISPIATQNLSRGATTSLTLPKDAKITSISLFENRLAVHFQAPSGSGIRILNTQSGNIENTINITPAIPQN